MHAITTNGHIAACNRKEDLMHLIEPLQNTIHHFSCCHFDSSELPIPCHQEDSSGLVHTTNLYGHLEAVQHLLVPINPPSAIGTTPPGFNPALSEYHKQDIVRLIMFYNDNFGIVQGENLLTAISRFHYWLHIHQMMTLFLNVYVALLQCQCFSELHQYH